MGTGSAGRRTVLWRAIAVLALAGIVGGILAAGPSGAATFAKKKKVFTKKQSDARFLNLGEGVSSTVTYVRSAPVEIEPTGAQEERVEAVCPAGTRVIGGGGYTEVVDMYLEASYPSRGTSVDETGTQGWTVRAINYGIEPGDLTAYATCISAGPNAGNLVTGADPGR
ncbi:MAG: hypothetical protein M3135_01045 [Actinomycetota bacterium]|nr:hypothetical protein [Actinomycetota bacterium]